jgi:hypothetical protein
MACPPPARTRSPTPRLARAPGGRYADDREHHAPVLCATSRSWHEQTHTKSTHGERTRPPRMPPERSYSTSQNLYSAYSGDESTITTSVRAGSQGHAPGRAHDAEKFAGDRLANIAPRHASITPRRAGPQRFLLRAERDRPPPSRSRAVASTVARRDHMSQHRLVPPRLNAARRGERTAGDRTARRRSRASGDTCRSRGWQPSAPRRCRIEHGLPS